MIPRSLSVAALLFAIAGVSLSDPGNKEAAPVSAERPWEGRPWSTFKKGTELRWTEGVPGDGKQVESSRRLTDISEELVTGKDGVKRSQVTVTFDEKPAAGNAGKSTVVENPEPPAPVATRKADPEKLWVGTERFDCTVVERDYKEEDITGKGEVVRTEKEWSSAAFPVNGGVIKLQKRWTHVDGAGKESPMYESTRRVEDLGRKIKAGDREFDCYVVRISGAEQVSCGGPAKDTMEWRSPGIPGGIVRREGASYGMAGRFDFVFQVTAVNVPEEKK